VDRHSHLRLRSHPLAIHPEEEAGGLGEVFGNIKLHLREVL
jgi:hypothetical protein